MNNSKPTQCDRVIRHLKDFGSITQVEALAEYGVMRLASRVRDLRKLGYLIDTEMVHGKNRYGEKTHYARYFLSEERTGTAL